MKLLSEIKQLSKKCLGKTKALFSRNKIKILGIIIAILGSPWVFEYCTSSSINGRVITYYDKAECDSQENNFGSSVIEFSISVSNKDYELYETNLYGITENKIRILLEKDDCKQFDYFEPKMISFIYQDDSQDINDISVLQKGIDIRAFFAFKNIKNQSSFISYELELIDYDGNCKIININHSDLELHKPRMEPSGQ